MSKYIKSDYEISIPVLIRHLLKHWLPIILAAAACAGLLTGYKVYQQKAEDEAVRVGLENVASALAEGGEENESEIQEEMYEQYAQEYADYQASASLLADSQEHLLSLIAIQQDYVANSLYMQIDPYHVASSDAELKVVMSMEDFTTDMGGTGAYYTLSLRSGDYLNDLAEEMGTDTSYLEELITTSYTNPKAVDFEGGAVLIDDDPGEEIYGRIDINIVGSSQEQTEQIMDAMLAELDRLHEERSKDLDHELVMLSRTCLDEVSTTVRDKQLAAYTYTNNLYTQYKYTVSNASVVTDDDIETIMAQYDEDGNLKETVSSISKKTLIKYVLAGGLVGAVLMAAWFLMRYILDDKVRSQERLKERFNLRDLGDLTRTAAEGDADGYDLVAARLRGAAGNGRKILVTGSGRVDKISELSSALAQRMPGYTVTSAGEVTRDITALNSLSECDLVVLAEQKGVSTCSQLQSQIEAIELTGKEIAGAVII